MNRFEIEGKVVKVEMKRGPRQVWYLAYLQTDDGEEVGVPVFGDPPQVGGSIWATGRLHSHEGYLRLKIEKIKLAKPVRKGLPVALTRGGRKRC